MTDDIFENKDLFNICNMNKKNIPSNDVYEYFNNFIFLMILN